MNNKFFVRSDGYFQADLGCVLLKAEQIGETEGYHFSGTASTQDEDREGEVLIQKGLDFSPFVEHGEFNWNHINHAIVGYPVGKKAWFEDGVWKAEGEIIRGLPISKNYDTDMVVQQHNQLQKAQTGRGLRMSVEGQVEKRSQSGKFVEKAKIYNIALTFRPQNPNCSLTMLAKSMSGKAQLESNDSFYKSLSVSDAQPFMKQDLEGASQDNLSVEKYLVAHLVKKGWDKKKAQAHVNKFLIKKFQK
ncbi:MAG: hypothetical protein ACXVCY_04230 [Pseudobdellovibrionaceae bacterium]